MPGPHARQSLCRNPLFAGEDELAEAAPGVPNNDSGTPSHISAIFPVPTPVSALSFAPAKLVAKYTNADLQRAIKLALESFVQGK